MIATVEYYRVVTGDVTTAASAVSANLLEAEGMLDDALHRKLAYGEYTETLPLLEQGRVHPSAVPVLSVTGDAVIGENGWSVYELYPDERGGFPVLIDDPWRPWSDSPFATITYVGGYTDATAPPTLKRSVCRLAYALTTPASTSPGGVPAGATSVRLGDAQVTFADPVDGDGATVDALVPGLWRQVRGYKHRLR